MKKQINGKKYSTQAAQKIGYGLSDKDELECMYVKRNGAAFTIGKANNITPLTEEQALIWARRNRLIVQYVAAVDYAINDKKQVSIYLTEHAQANLRKLCDLWNTSQSETVEKILQDSTERAEETERIKEQLLKELELKYGFKPEK